MNSTDAIRPTERAQPAKETINDKAAPAATPKDAAAIILVRSGANVADAPQVFWARRNEKLAFLGGFHAFPGGQRDADDAHVAVLNCADEEAAAMISCAARELFEETGVLAARGAETLTVGQRASVADDLTSGRMQWSELLTHYGLRLDATDFTFAGRWVTPPFSPRRFDTWFFLVNCPPKQTPKLVDNGELADGEWLAAREAVNRWQQSQVLLAPPVLHALKVLRDGLTEDVMERFLSVPEARREQIRRIEFRPGFICFPLRTPTKPPATHTNCFLVGGKEFIVIDPASIYADEQVALAACVDDLLAEGRILREIVLTHLHPDHTGGVNALREHLRARHNLEVNVAAHELTAAELQEKVRVDRLIADEEMFELPGNDDAPDLNLRALHTPGHARGHLCFYEEKTGALLTGDNIVGLGSVLIDPPEGNMRDYLNSLERLKTLPNLTVLFGAHGAPVGAARAKIDEYIAHRLERENNILKAVQNGAETIPSIVAAVYTDVHPKALPMAERAALAHLEKLMADGAIKNADDERYSVVG